MKKLIKISLMLGLVLLLAGNAWAFPVVGDQLTVTHGNSGVYDVIEQDSTHYVAFCLDRDRHFGPTSIVYAVGDTVYNDLQADTSVINDPVGQDTFWLYQSYMTGLFGYGDIERNQVQQAIWFAEQEIDNSSWYDSLTFGVVDFSTTWNIAALSLEDAQGTFKQAMLIGTPEPASMLLFGMGLLGFAGITRRKIRR